MARTDIDKRSRLVSAAVGLAYQNGFGATSLADIAREAEVPLGNVYYYFKTKDEIGEAIVELRLADMPIKPMTVDRCVYEGLRALTQNRPVIEFSIS
jgi:AcrR family transcriptional regulator